MAEKHTLPPQIEPDIKNKRNNLQIAKSYANIYDGGSDIINNMEKDLETSIEKALKGVHTNSIFHCNVNNRDGKGDYYKTKNPNMRAKTRIDLLQKLYDYYFGVEKYTFEEMYIDWLSVIKEDVSNEIITYNTYTHYKSIYNRFIKSSDINNKLIVEIKVSEILRFYKISVGNQKITRNDLNNIKTLVNSVFEHANQQYDLTVINPRTINTRNLPCKEIVHKKYTNEERETLIQAAVNGEGWNNPHILAYLLDTQLDARIGEVIALSWEDIDWNTRTVYIHSEVVRRKDINGNSAYIKLPHTKNKKQEGNRVLPLTDFSIQILKQARKLNPFGECLFMNNGHYILAELVNRSWKKLCDKVGIRYLSTHKNRVWAITAMYSANIDKARIQRTSGHATAEMTDYYICLDEEQQQKLAVGHEEWDNIFSPKSL